MGINWSDDPDRRSGEKALLYGVAILIIVSIFFIAKEQNAYNANKAVLSKATVTTKLSTTGSYVSVNVTIKNNSDKPITNGLGVYLRDATGNETILGYVNILVEPGMTRIGQVGKSIAAINGPGPYTVVTRW
jgi:hypothetical protein